MSKEQDFVTSISPMYIFSRFIGFVTSFASGDIGNRTFVKGTYYILYHVFFFLVHAALISGSFYFRLTTYKEYKYDGRIVLFSVYTSLFISIVVVICHHIFRNSFQKTLNNLVELDKLFSGLGLQIDHNAVYKGVFGIISFLLMTAVWFTVITTMSTKLRDFYFYFLFFFQYLVTMTMKSHFCAFNVVIKYRFQTLDDKLKEVIDSTRGIMEPNTKVILVGNGQNRDNFSQSVFSPAYKIITLSEYHSKLYNIAKRINLFYSVQILLIIGKYFVEITATLYYNLQKIYRQNATYDVETFLLLIWAIMNAIDLLILVYVCDSMCSKVSCVH